MPIHNLMKDAATAKISRSQVWQWVVSPKGKLDDGRKVTVEMVRPMIAEELAKVKAVVSVAGEDTQTYDRAADIFDKMSLTPEYPEFLTLPLYEAMASGLQRKENGALRAPFSIPCRLRSTHFACQMLFSLPGQRGYQ